MILSTVKYGTTRWDLLRNGSRHYLRITTSREQYLYPVAYDARHQRFHPSTEDLMSMDPMDLKALNMLGRDALGEHPRENPTGVKGRTPLILKRYVASILRKAMRDQSGRPSKEEISKAFRFATIQLKKQKYIKPGTHQLTAAGIRKQAEITPEKRAEIDQAFSAWVEGRGVSASGKARAVRRPEAVKPKAHKAAPVKSKAQGRSRKTPKVKFNLRDAILGF